MENIAYRHFDLAKPADDSPHDDDATKSERLRVVRLRTVLHECFEMDGPNADLLMGVALGLGEFLVRKNKAYGDSALAPLRVFSNASMEEQIRVRIDDKLSRLARGHAAGEDAIVDLAGYLILLLAAREEE